jgi:hypothetical protein
MTPTDAVLVPLRIDAVAVVAAERDVPFRRPQMNFTAVKNFQTPEPEPFSEFDDRFVDDPGNRGVYLMWTLPEALRHARPAGTGDAATPFPPIPNRWLVVRTHTTAQQGPTHTAWILESDRIDSTRGTSPFIDPTAAHPVATAIGVKTRLDPHQPWTETSSARPFLTAVGAGDVGFAAFQPSNENVLSMHDDLVTQGISQASIDYAVVGWYANGDGDPLSDRAASGAPASFSEIMHSLGWSIAGNTAPSAATGEGPESDASRSVYHGMLLGLDWDDHGAPPASRRDEAMPGIALGATGLQALTAHLRSRGMDDSTATLLEAFAVDSLAVMQRPDGEQLLRRDRHASAFAPAFGGLRWGLADGPGDPSRAPAEAGAGPVDPQSREQEIAWLGRLNAAQQKLDEARRQLTSARQRLYELWWKRGYARSAYGPNGPSDPDDPDDPDRWPYGTTPDAFAAALSPTTAGSPAAAVASLAGAVQQAEATVRSLLDARPESVARDEGGAGRQLTQGLAGRFYGPQDPVLLLAGLGGDDPGRDEGLLVCRLPQDVLSAVTTPSGGSTTTRGAADVAMPPLPASGLPPETSALLAEFALVRWLRGVDPAGFGGRLDAASFRGRLPCIRPEPWRQAWLPLYLEWEVEWHPLPYRSAPGSGWVFDGHDFRFEGSPPAKAGHETVSGRTTLTPGLARTLRRRLEQHLTDIATGAQLDDLAGTMAAPGGWDFLAQTLEGLTTEIAWRDGRISRVPDGAAAALIDGEQHAAPKPRDPDPPGYGAPWVSTFEGMRAGQIVLGRLSIVDRFGRVLDVHGQGSPTSAPVAVAADLTPARPVATSVSAEMPPRLLQPARLSLEPIPASAPTWPASASSRAGDDPVIGFLVPNHLDGALALHDGAGARQGELRRVTTVRSAGADRTASTQERVVWDSRPHGRTLDDLDTSEPALAALARRLVDVGPEAFAEFLAAVDETLWTIDPLHADDDEYLTVLVGRPLALVRARLSLEILGEPLRDPSWPATFQTIDPPFLDQEFPVRLGAPEDRDDGLIGYLLDGASIFHVVRHPEAGDGPGDPGGFVRTADPEDLRLRPRQAVNLELLVDPRGEIHASCGLLPTTALDLPHDRLSAFRRTMSTAFRVGPALALPAPLFPTPTASGQAWSWVEHESEPRALARTDDRAHFPEARPSAREGFVVITPERDET